MQLVTLSRKYPPHKICQWWQWYLFVLLFLYNFLIESFGVLHHVPQFYSPPAPPHPLSLLHPPMAMTSWLWTAKLRCTIKSIAPNMSSLQRPPLHFDLNKHQAPSFYHWTVFRLWFQTRWTFWSHIQPYRMILYIPWLTSVRLWIHYSSYKADRIWIEINMESTRQAW